MVIPIEQTPIPFDPARQQLTLPPPPEVPTPTPPADIPVQATDTNPDKFSPDTDGRGGSGQRNPGEQDFTAATQRLQVAYARLLQLQQEASAAVQSGDASRAKEVASEAAGVAEFIEAAASTLPLSAINGMVVAAEQTQTQQYLAEEASVFAFPPTVTEPPAVPPEVPAALDTAWAGLGTAKTVVESAASLPHHTLPDRIAIDGMRRQVLDAMAGVEAIAARLAAAYPAPAVHSRQVDIRA